MGMYSTAQEIKYPKNLYTWHMDMDNSVGMAWGSCGEGGGAGWKVKKGRTWDNYNSIINNI